MKMMSEVYTSTNIYESPVARKFKETRDMGTRRMEKMIETGILPKMSSIAQKEYVSSFQKFSNLRDTEDKILRLDILERIKGLQRSYDGAINLHPLTAMFLELSRKLNDEEFQQELEESSLYVQETRKKLLVPVVEKIPPHLIEGYYNGHDILIRKSNIILADNQKRRALRPRNITKHV